MTSGEVQPIDATPLADEPLPSAQWLGPWPGVVVSTEDPLKHGRVRVRVPQVYGDPETETDFIPDADLPWALPSFPVHDYHADLEPGDGVHVEFWGGNPAFPVWRGQYLGEGDAPSEFTSAYSPTPKTRILRTTNGHIIELRWVAAQEEIRVLSAGGQKLRLVDADALGGPKIELWTAGGFKLTIDQKTQKVTLETPGARSILLDDSAQKIVVTTTQHSLELDDAGGKVKLDATGDIEVTATGDVKATATGSIEETATGDITDAATGDYAASGVNVSLMASVLAELLGAQVHIGGSPFFKLMDERLIALLNVMVATFNAHVHVGTPITSPPLAPQIPVILDTANTVIAKGG